MPYRIASLFNPILYPGLCLRLPLRQGIAKSLRYASKGGKEVNVFYVQGINITISNQAPFVHRRQASSGDSILFLVTLKDSDTLWPLHNSSLPYLLRDTNKILANEKELAGQLRSQTPHDNMEDFNNELALRASLREARGETTI